MKNKYIIIAGLILILIIGYLLYVIRDLRDSNKSKDSVITEQQATITYRTNKEGKLIADKQAAEARLQDFVKAYPLLAEQIKSMGIDVKNLKAAYQAKFVVEGKGNTTIVHNHYTDSTGRKQDSTHLNVSDGYLTFHATLYDSLHTAYKYIYQDEITVATYIKKKWFLGKKQMYSSSMLGNKNAKVTNSTDVLIKDYKDKRFSIGPYVGYDVFKNKLSGGISLQWALFKF